MSNSERILRECRHDNRQEIKLGRETLHVCTECLNASRSARTIEDHNRSIQGRSAALAELEKIGFRPGDQVISSGQSSWLGPFGPRMTGTLKVGKNGNVYVLSGKQHYQFKTPLYWIKAA